MNAQNPQAPHFYPEGVVADLPKWNYQTPSGRSRDLTDEEREQQRQANRVRRSELMKTCKLTIEDFGELKYFMFPDPIAKIYDNTTGRLADVVFGRDDIQRWQERLKTTCAKFLR